MLASEIRTTSGDRNESHAGALRLLLRDPGALSRPRCACDERRQTGPRRPRCHRNRPRSASIQLLLRVLWLIPRATQEIRDQDQRSRFGSEDNAASWIGPRKLR